MWKGDPEMLPAPQALPLQPPFQPSGGEFPGSGSASWARWPPNQTPKSVLLTAVSKVTLIVTSLSTQFLRQSAPGGVSLIWVMECTERVEQELGAQPTLNSLGGLSARSASSTSSAGWPPTVVGPYGSDGMVRATALL